MHKLNILVLCQRKIPRGKVGKVGIFHFHFPRPLFHSIPCFSQRSHNDTNLVQKAVLATKNVPFPVEIHGKSGKMAFALGRAIFFATRENGAIFLRKMVPFSLVA